MIKKNLFCPVRMICKIGQNGSINVTYFQTHSHDNKFEDTFHHPIPKSVRAKIKKLLLMGASVEYIEAELTEGIFSLARQEEPRILRKKHVITRRQIREIKRKLKVNLRMHSDDATSLKLLVPKITQQYNDPILLYKPEGEKNL